MLKGIDAVLWIDGVNDIFTSHSSRSIGMDGDAAFNFPAKFNVKRFAFAGAAGASDEVEIANNYVRQRKYYVDILTSLGIRSVNILQPSFSKKVDYRSSCLEELFISTRKKGYDQLIPYLKAIGDDHGVKFEHLEQGTPELTFWDHFHLSPASEQIFAKAISSSVVKIIP